MKNYFLAAVIVSALAACGGGGSLDVPGDCIELEPAANPSAACLYQLPAGASCDGLRIYSDDVALPASAYAVVCGAGQVSVSGCADGAVVVACVSD